VIVRASERYRETVQAIRELPIQLPSGQRTQLDRLAEVKLENAPQAIYRENGYRRIGVKFNVEGRDLGSVMKEIQAKATQIKIPPGYRIEWGGEYENQSRAMKRFMVVLPATILLIGLVLFFLFQDLRVVGANIITLLISLVGSVLFLVFRGIPFSVSAAVGLLVLFGVITLNNVALTNAFLGFKRSGLSVIDAIKRACADQFRALMMTSILAALGLLPAALSHSMGSETQRPLATAVIGGVFTGLPSVLFVLPYLLWFASEWRVSEKNK
jgi:cobalt-zinc-cadmium resistance protein CzcA